MKNITIFLLAIYVVLGSGLAEPTFAVDTITVTSPESGRLPYGHLAWFTWEGGDSYDEVLLELYRQSGGVVVIAGSETTRVIGTVSNTGLYTWSVPSDLYLADDYLLRVSAAETPSVFDISDTTFGVAENVDDDPPVVVTYPVDGQTFMVGDTITITWTGMPAAYTAFIWLEQDGVGVKTGSVPGNPGSYTWTFDADHTGTGFRFSVRSNVDFSNIDYSGTFSIEPEGGSIAEPDAPEYTVALSQPDEVGMRVLIFSITGIPTGAVGYRLYESTAEGYIGAMRTDIPVMVSEIELRTDTHNLPRGNLLYYTLRSYNAEGGESSNIDSTIVFIPPVGHSVKLLAPNGGEVYAPGGTMTISWQAEGYNEIFPILTKGNVCGPTGINGEESCGVLVIDSLALPEFTSEESSYMWTLPEHLESGDDYRFGLWVDEALPPLSSEDLIQLIYQSDAPFSIRTDPFSDGELVRTSGDSKIFVYRNGELHHIPDMATLTAQRLVDDTVTVVDSSVLTGAPVGFTYLPEGALIRVSNGVDVYIIKYAGEKQFRRLILNPSVFNSYGHLRWEDVRDVNPEVVSAFPEAILVRVAGTNQIYRLTPNGDVGVRQRISETKLAMTGLDIESVYEINSADFDNYTEGDPLE